MSDLSVLKNYLVELEEITNINGCYFIDVINNKVMESTIPFEIPEEILWEICTMKDTFQHFSKGIEHGDLQELILEGDKGYILVYSVTPNVILLATGTNDLNLPYVKLAMIDLLNRIRSKMEEFDFEPIKQQPMPVEPIESIYKNMETSEKVITSEFIKISENMEPPKDIETPKIMETSELSEKVTTPKIQPIKQEQKETIITDILEQEEINLEELVKTFVSEDNIDIHQTLLRIFNALKMKLNTMSKADLSNILDTLKDSILN
ncbi:MAG: hypothetical protein P8Y70_12400, partial [Candidatus Lokiarchaeota archaeon]